MPYQTRRVHARSRAPLQIDLFAGGPQKAIGEVPAWPSLPKEIRATLTHLITRLLLEHADKNWTGSMTETGHEH
jgi:hypothetical protein